MTINAATLTGLVDLLNPDPSTITLSAMAHGLAQINRWSGSLSVPFSVAQHSMLVRETFIRIAPQLAPWSLWALKHDGHEYLIGDITTPAAHLLGAYDSGFETRLDNVKRRLDRVIDVAFALPPIEAVPTGVFNFVAIADSIAAHLEWRAFMPAGNGHAPYVPTIKFPHLRPRPLSWPDAADAFKEAFERELAERSWERVAA